MFDLTDHVGLVTGAGQGVGERIAKALAASGAAVGVNDLRAERAERVAQDIRDAGGVAIAVAADVTDGAAAAAMVQQVSSAIADVDILVNNAGIPPTGTRPLPFVETTDLDWRDTIALNLYGVLYCTRAALEPMIGKAWGRVLTITSEAGRLGEAQLAVYSAAKAGAAGLSRAIAKEVGAKGITSNCLSLGSIYSERDHPDPDRMAKVIRRYPAGRLGTPLDVAAAVLWLTSEEASWVTGQTISINGGFAAT